MRTARIAGWALGLLIGVCPLGVARANAISSFVSATADATTNSSNVTGPGTFNASATSGLDTSSTSATVGSGGVSLTLNQSIPGQAAFGDVALIPGVSNVSGELFYVINPSVNTTFNLTGTFTTTGVPNIAFGPTPDSDLAFSPFIAVASFLNATLSEIGGETLFSDFKNGFNNSTLTFDPHVGTLQAGHSYSLTVNGGMNNTLAAIDPTGTGNINFALAPVGPNVGVTAPLPRGAWGGLLLLIGMVAASARRSARRGLIA